MSTSAEPLAPAVLTDAIIAYVGRGRRKIPTADPDAARAVAPQQGDALLDAVKSAIAASDTIALTDLEERGGTVRESFDEHLRSLRPDLEPRAREALAWRWAFLAYHG